MAARIIGVDGAPRRGDGRGAIIRSAAARNDFAAGLDQAEHDLDAEYLPAGG
jgi:hypothetical protein